MKNQLKAITTLIAILVLNACATFKAQYDSERFKDINSNKKIAHSFYLIGDAGNIANNANSNVLKMFESELSKASKNSTALFLGDNIYPKGLPKKGSDGRNNAEQQLNAQINAVSNFKGEAIFIPGNHDWYSQGLKGLKRQENYIEDNLGKNTFLPENGCPLERINISDEIEAEIKVVSFDSFPDELPVLPKAPRQDAPNAATEAALLYTSGTTGKPKGCVLTNEYFHTFGASYLFAGGRLDFRDTGERLYNPLPLHHANCLSISVPAMLMSGGCVIFPDRFHASTWWKDLVATKATAAQFQGIIPNILLGGVVQIFPTR